MYWSLVSCCSAFVHVVGALTPLFLGVCSAVPKLRVAGKPLHLDRISARHPACGPSSAASPCRPPTRSPHPQRRPKRPPPRARSASASDTTRRGRQRRGAARWGSAPRPHAGRRRGRRSNSWPGPIRRTAAEKTGGNLSAPCGIYSASPSPNPNGHPGPPERQRATKRPCTASAQLPG